MTVNAQQCKRSLIDALSFPRPNLLPSEQLFPIVSPPLPPSLQPRPIYSTPIQLFAAREAGVAAAISSIPEATPIGLPLAAANWSGTRGTLVIARKSREAELSRLELMLEGQMKPLASSRRLKLNLKLLGEYE